MQSANMNNLWIQIPSNDPDLMCSAVFPVNPVCGVTCYQSACFSFPWKSEAFCGVTLKLSCVQTRSHGRKDDEVSGTLTKDVFFVLQSPDRCSRETQIWVTVL